MRPTKAPQNGIRGATVDSGSFLFFLFWGDFDGLRVVSCLRGAPVPMREKILPHGMMDATLPPTVALCRKFYTVLRWGVIFSQISGKNCSEKVEIVLFFLQCGFNFWGPASRSHFFLKSEKNGSEKVEIVLLSPLMGI